MCPGRAMSASALWRYGSKGCHGRRVRNASVEAPIPEVVVAELSGRELSSRLRPWWPRSTRSDHACELTDLDRERSGPGQTWAGACGVCRFSFQAPASVLATMSLTVARAFSITAGPALEGAPAS